MLQILKIHPRSERACRSLFQLFQPLSYLTLGFQHVEKAQHALLSDPRAVTLLISIHKNHATLLYAMPTREYTFLSYCNSRPRGVPKLRNGVLTIGATHFVFVLGALGARHNVEVCNISYVRMQCLRMLVVNVLLALRFFTYSIDLQLVEYAPAISNNKPQTCLILFLRTRFYNAMSLPPKPQQQFVFIRDDCVGTRMSFPRWRCREIKCFCSRLCFLSQFVVVPALFPVHSFGFFNLSNGISLVLIEVTLGVMFGDLGHCTRQIRHVYFARGVRNTMTDFARVKHQ